MFRYSIYNIVQHDAKQIEFVMCNNKRQEKTSCVTYTEKYSNDIMTA